MSNFRIYQNYDLLLHDKGMNVEIIHISKIALSRQGLFKIIKNHLVEKVDHLELIQYEGLRATEESIETPVAIYGPFYSGEFCVVFNLENLFKVVFDIVDSSINIKC